MDLFTKTIKCPDGVTRQLMLSQKDLDLLLTIHDLSFCEDYLEFMIDYIVGTSGEPIYDDYLFSDAVSRYIENWNKEQPKRRVRGENDNEYVSDVRKAEAPVSSEGDEKPFPSFTTISSYTVMGVPQVCLKSQRFMDYYSDFLNHHSNDDDMFHDLISGRHPQDPVVT